METTSTDRLIELRDYYAAKPWGVHIDTAVALNELIELRTAIDKAAFPDIDLCI